MKKPRSKEKLAAERRRGEKRNKRFKDSRKKVAKKRELALAMKKKQEREYQEFMTKMLEARMKGEF